jgi:hypothetical protein
MMSIKSQKHSEDILTIPYDQSDEQYWHSLRQQRQPQDIDDRGHHHNVLLHLTRNSIPLLRRVVAAA